jgi:hypothetical protein
MSHCFINSKKKPRNKGKFAICMDNATEEILLSSGWTGCAKLLHDLSSGGCGDCGGLIKEAKDHISFKARIG